LLGSSLGAFGLSSLYAPIQRQNVELKLKIKPQINESDYVRLEVDQQTEEIAEQDPVLGPTTSRRTAKTVIVAKDQTTVVIGGLVQERTIKSVAKTPILGDIPVLGWLFRDNSTTKVKTNLLLFLTPYIIRDQDDFRRIFERKMRERQQFIATFYGTAAEYEVPIDFARKAGPVALLARDVEKEMERLENGGPGTRGEIRIQPRAAEPAEEMPETPDVPMEDVPEPAAPAEEPPPAP
jgi:general secretion pathway protein D